MMKDPVYELSSVFVSVLQILVALMGGLFLWLSIMAFNGKAMMNMIMQMAGESQDISSEQTVFLGLVLLALFVVCIAAFFVLRYLAKVVKKETGT
ncbi:hypothetical protein GCM10028791_17590 [Echinicola sediminis]